MFDINIGLLLENEAYVWKFTGIVLAFPLSQIPYAKIG
jgi:hypothetical protein